LLFFRIELKMVNYFQNGAVGWNERKQKQPLRGRIMTSHIKVNYKVNGVQVSRIYAVTDDIWREQFGRHVEGKDLQVWLETRGCQLDSSDGPALVRRGADGSTRRAYYRNGALHREDGPALIVRDADGSTYEAYYLYDQLSREDGPAVVKHNADGSTLEMYYRAGKAHREDGPAIVKHNTDGSTDKVYYRDGKCHREDGPASATLYADGRTSEGFYRDNKPHRADGPAIVQHNADGSTLEMYYRNGVLERMKNTYEALSTGLLLPPVNGGPEAIDAILREAIADQSTPVRSCTREYVLLPLWP
jgi:hypothetical protein